MFPVSLLPNNSYRNLFRIVHNMIHIPWMKSSQNFAPLKFHELEQHWCILALPAMTCNGCLSKRLIAYVDLSALIFNMGHMTTITVAALLELE